MSEKSRNFRSSYYDKVGFRGVEEKKSLEILINEKPMDKEKLSKFCLRFTLPSIYREYVWKIILGVISVNSESQDLIMSQRKEHYTELEDALKVMCHIKENTPKPLVHTLMFLMTNDVIEFDIQKQLSSSKVQNLIALASLFIEMSSSDIVAFWIFRNFVLHQRKFCCNYKSLKENVESILRKEDDILYEHLKHIKAFDILPLKSWFERCFAEVLHESSLARICDKVIGGSCKILPYVAVSLMTVRRTLLLPLTDPTKLTEILKTNPEDISDVAVNTGLEMYFVANH